LTEYAVVYEQAGDGSWSARAADLPVFSAGRTREEAEQEVKAGIKLHLEVLAEHGEPMPEEPIRIDAGTVTVEFPTERSPVSGSPAS
jgi:predicted RNase H-like HicB family nuclease